MRTNIFIDDELIKKAMFIASVSTKKDVVAIALQEFVDRHTRKNLADLYGKIEFADDYDYKAMRKTN